MILDDAWYAAAFTQELRRQPLGRTLLGRETVLFRDAAGRACALGAACPHRGADLSRGRVIDGLLECPFHGWRFDGCGRCVRVPSQPAHVKLSPNARAPAFELREQQGILWIRTGVADGSRADPPAYPVLEPAAGHRTVAAAPLLVHAPFLTVVEAALDLAHLPFVHRGSLGTGQSPLVARQHITVDSDGRGLDSQDDADSPWEGSGTFMSGRKKWLARLFGVRDPVAWSHRFDLGGVVQTRAAYADGTWDLAFQCITPADAQRTWVFVEAIRTRALHCIGDLAQRWFMRSANREDARILGSLLATDPAGSVSVAADRTALAFRRLYSRQRDDAAGCGRADPR
jgi:phenylpropionate dioxygenase-like ring-hydroxylating dioxygenase large terminal subunit